jgi:hypothetical protein
MSGTTRKPWVIYGQDGTTVVKLRAGSVRFGRTMRAAQAINRYTQASVFISQEDSASPTLGSRFYTSNAAGHTLEAQQERNRRQLSQP